MIETNRETPEKKLRIAISAISTLRLIVPPESAAPSSDQPLKLFPPIGNGDSEGVQRASVASHRAGLEVTEANGALEEHRDQKHRPGLR